MKKVLLWLIIGLLSLSIMGPISLVGCTKATVETAAATTAAETTTAATTAAVTLTESDEFNAWLADTYKNYSGTEIKVAVASHPAIEALKAMTPQFEEKTGIKVVWDEMEEGILLDKFLVDATSGKSSYDVVMMCPEFTPTVVDLNLLTPLDDWFADKEKTPDWVAVDDILPAYRNMLYMNDHFWGLPFCGETIFMLYRKDIFDKYDLKVPTTFDELLETAKFINENVPDMAGISMRTRRGWEATYMWSVFIFPFGGKIIDFDANKPALDQKETIDSLKYFVELCKYGPVGIETFSYPESFDAFMQGKAGIMVEASFAASEAENPDKSIVAGKVGWAPMPTGPAGAFSGAWGWGLSLVDASEKKDAAWAFITYMTGKPMQSEYIANGGVVSRTSWLEDPKNQEEFPYYQAIIDTIKQATNLQTTGYGVVIMDPAWGPLSEMIGTEVSRAVTGEITVEEAAKNMQEQAVEIWESR